MSSPDVVEITLSRPAAEEIYGSAPPPDQLPSSSRELRTALGNALEPRPIRRTWWDRVRYDAVLSAGWAAIGAVSFIGGVVMGDIQRTIFGGVALALSLLYDIRDSARA